jgi:ATP-dependent DNA ligase
MQESIAREPVPPFALTRQAGRGASGRLNLSLERASPFRKIDGVLRLQIVKRTHEPFDGDDWLFEIKHDGFRMLAIRDGGPTRLFTRNGYDFTQRNRPIAAVLDRLSAERFVLDGELVMLEHQVLTSLESRSKSAWQTVRGQGGANLDLFFPRVGENYDHQSL